MRENRAIVKGSALPVQSLDKPAFGWVPAVHRMGSMVVMEDGHWVAYTPGKSQYRNSPPTQLGPGQYFLIGDNRDNSLDSRAFGPVSIAQIVGKALVVIPTGRRVARRD